MAMYSKEDIRPFQSAKRGETLILKRDSDVSVVEVKDVTDEYHGSSKQKSRFEVLPILNAEGIPEKLFMKRVNVEGSVCFGSETIDQVESVRYYERWKFCKSIGIPTLSDMWVVDEERVAMEDRRAFGGMFFGKHKYVYVSSEVLSGIRRELTPEEKYFLEEVDVDEVLTRFEEVQAIALANNVIFGWDDPAELFVDGDGNWEICVVDLELLDKASGNEGLVEYSRNTVRVFLNKIKAELKKLQSM